MKNLLLLNLKKLNYLCFAMGDSVNHLFNSYFFTSPALKRAVINFMFASCIAEYLFADKKFAIETLP